MSNEVNTNENAVQVVEPKNEVARVNMFSDEGFNLELDLTTTRSQYCSMLANTEDEKTAIFNAMNNPDYRVSDYIGKVITVKHVYMEIVDCTNTETGEVTPAPRIVLIDDKNKSYQCVSVGIYSAMKKLFQAFGTPDVWEKPIKLEVKQVTKGVRSMLTVNKVM